MKQTWNHEILDQLTQGGLVRPSLNALIGRPGMGRTKWALEKAFYQSKSGINTLFITLETSIQDNIEHLFKILGKEEIATHPMNTLHLIESSAATIHLLVGMIQNNVEKKNVSVIWIDSIDYLLNENGQYMQTEEEYLTALSSLEALAVELNITILFTHGLIRTVDVREDKRPLLTDITPVTSRSFLHTVIGLYRDELYNPETHAANTVEVHLLKHGEDETLKTYNELYTKKKQV